MSKKYVLTGVGGGIGSGAADYVLSIREPGQKLVFTTTSLSRLPEDKLATWRAAGVDIQEASYDDIASLTKVFQGAEAIAWISTWNFGQRIRQSANVLAAAEAAGVRRVLYSSFMGAELGVDTEEARRWHINELPFLPRDHALTERLILESGLSWNTQRNNIYQEGGALLFSRVWKFCGDKWFNNSGGKRAAYVAREDCARVFGALLLGRGEPNRAYYVTGPEAVTDLEVMNYIKDRSGYTKAEMVDIWDDELRAWWAERGMTTDAIEMLKSDLLPLCLDDMVCCGQMLRWGILDKVTDTVEKLTGRKALGFRENYVKYESMFPKGD